MTRSRPWWPPQPATVARQMPLGRGSPCSRVNRSLGQGSPRTRAQRPLGRGPPHSRAKRPVGQGPPRSRAQHPLGEDCLARGHLHACRPRSCPRARAFNAPTPQDTRHDPNTPGNLAPVLFHRLPGEGHPRHCVALCDEADVSLVTLRRLLLYD
jgi:hypothetical protein